MNITYRNYHFELYILKGMEKGQEPLLFAPKYRYLARISKAQSEILNCGELQASPEADAIFEPLIIHNRRVDQRLLAHDQINHPWYEYHISLSNQCDYRCRHCYRNMISIHASRQNMNRTQLEKVTRAIFVHKKDSKSFPVIHISFRSSGEPTTNSEFLQHAEYYLRDEACFSGIPIRFSMITNCDYNKKLTPFILKRFADVGIAFAGPADIYAEQKQLRGIRATYTQALQNVKALYKSKKVDTYFFLTLTATIAKRWHEVIDFYAKEFPECKVKVFPRSHRSCGLDSGEGVVEEQMFYRICSEMYQYAKGRIRLSIPNTEAEEFFQRGLGLSLHKQLLIASTGEVVVCTQSGILLSHGWLNLKTGELKCEELVSQRSECEDCFCKYTCAGGYLNSPKQTITEEFCAFVRRITAQELFLYSKKV